MRKRKLFCSFSPFLFVFRPHANAYSAFPKTETFENGDFRYRVDRRKQRLLKTVLIWKRIRVDYAYESHLSVLSLRPGSTSMTLWHRGNYQRWFFLRMEKKKSGVLSRLQVKMERSLHSFLQRSVHHIDQIFIIIYLLGRILGIPAIWLAAEARGFFAISDHGQWNPKCQNNFSLISRYF